MRRACAGVVNLPKHEMVQRMKALVRTGRFEIAANVPLLREFRRELEGFERVRSGSGNWNHTGKTNGTDDLVMARFVGEEKH